MRPVTRYCRTCGTSYRGHKSKVYCSPACRPKRIPWNKGATGLPANRLRNGAEKECAVCGGTFYVPRGRLQARYCSPECYWQGRWGESRREERECVTCAATFECFRSDSDVVCSRRCDNLRKSRIQSGENSILWRGGKVAPYVGEWQQRRREALDRDGHRCTVCGSDDRPQVHHIVPWRYSRSHALENLTTLCRSCHSREELRVNAKARAGLDARWA
jgi:5-methylcytosine-specific restriction endonuclease McrA